MALQSNAPIGPIMLITDLSARCDRALDRAVELARHHNVRLIALHVIETSFLTKLAEPAWRTRQQEHQQVARQRLLDDLEHTQVDLEVVVEIGHPVETINEVAARYGCSLIVSGTARDESLGRVMLGNTVERLARQCETPLLVVRRRPFGEYHRVMVGTDFSTGSRHALEAALELMPESSLTLYHSFDQVAGIYDLDAPTVKETIQHLQKKATEFVAQTARIDTAAPPAVVIEHGSPGKVLPAYVQAHQIELVVLGTHGMTGILRTAMGSIAEQLLSLLRCDVMIVRQRHSEDV